MDYNSLTDTLRDIGLSDKESTVYVALLELGGAYPTKIAEYTKLNRSTVYKILLDLSVKGLVTEIEKRKKLYYQIEKPKQILKYSRERVRLAKRQLERTQKIFPEIEGLFSMIPHKPTVRFFDGVQGVKDVFRDHIEQDCTYEMLGYSNTAELIKFLPQSFMKAYVKKKEKLGVVTRGILPDTRKDLDYNKTVYAHVKKNIWPDIRFVPANMFPYNSELTIYGEKSVSIVNFHNPGLIGVIIEDETIYGMMKMIFELAWIGAKDKKALSAL